MVENGLGRYPLILPPDKREGIDERMYYFLCVRPPKYVSDFINAIKSLSTGKPRFSLPPHSTLFPPFIIEGASEKKFIKSLRGVFSEQNPFSITITLEQIDAFDDNHVVFFKPNKLSTNRLRKIHFRFIDNLKDQVRTESIYIGKDYNPHMTINNKAPDEILKITHEHISKLPLKFTFEIGSLYLYKALKEEEWRQAARISLGR